MSTAAAMNHLAISDHDDTPLKEPPTRLSTASFSDASSSTDEPQEVETKKKSGGWLFGGSSKSKKAKKLTREAILESLTQPYVDEAAWAQLTGNEFQEHGDKLLGPFAAEGEELALKDESTDWVNWKPYGSHNKEDIMNDDVIHVWTGRPNRKGNWYRGNIPIIKARAVIPWTPLELIEHTMDNDKLYTYNPYSMGRVDKWVSDDLPHTKIVRNENRIPIGSSKLAATTLLHARPACSPAAGKGAWIYMSRAIGGTALEEEGDAKLPVQQSVLGAILLQPVDNDEKSCIMTFITQGYSSLMPSLLSERLQVKGALKFLSDLKALKDADGKMVLRKSGAMTKESLGV